MRIDELLRAGERPVFSFEFGPPRTPEAELSLWQAVEELRALDPAFVSVTWGAGGSTRGATLETVRRMHELHGLEAMPHLTCIGSTRAGAALAGARDRGRRDRQPARAARRRRARRGLDRRRAGRARARGERHLPGRRVRPGVRRARLRAREGQRRRARCSSPSCSSTTRTTSGSSTGCTPRASTSRCCRGSSRSPTPGSSRGWSPCAARASRRRSSASSACTPTTRRRSPTSASPTRPPRRPSCSPGGAPGVHLYTSQPLARDARRGVGAHRPPAAAMSFAVMPGLTVHDDHLQRCRRAGGGARSRARTDLPFAVQATGHGRSSPPTAACWSRPPGMAEVLVDPDRRDRPRRAGRALGRGHRGGRAVRPRAASPAPRRPSASPASRSAAASAGSRGSFGLAADNLLRADVVTADGELVRATPTRNGDLFWALRGGGGNFGVVTSLELRPAPGDPRSTPAPRCSRSRAPPTTLELYRAWAPSMPDELTTAIVVLESPDERRAVLAARRVRRRARRRHASRCARCGTPPARRSPSDLRTMALRRDGDARRHRAARSSSCSRDLPDAVIDTALDTAIARDRRVEVRHWGGAMARGAGPGRPPRGAVLDHRRRARRAAPLARHATGGSFLNFLKDPSRTASAYTAANWERLREIKRAYDPDNVFRYGHNIPPARGSRRRGGAARSRPRRSGRGRAPAPGRRRAPPCSR